MSDYKKAFLKAHTELVLKRKYASMQANIDRLINSGALEIDSYDTEHNHMFLPEAIAAALLKDESDRYTPSRDKAKEFIAEVKNLQKFI